MASNYISNMMSLIAFIVFCLSQSSLTVANDICELGANINEWPLDRIFTNTQFQNYLEKTFTYSNATTLQECRNDCCATPTCNYAFFKENNGIHQCFLVTCKSENSCVQIKNEIKSINENLKPDFIIKIRATDSFQMKVSPSNQPSMLQINSMNNDDKMSANLNSAESELICIPNKFYPENKCPANEICIFSDQTKRYECACPIEQKFKRINNICREMFEYGMRCEHEGNQCQPNLNEECIFESEYLKQGTCQCKIGFKRNLKSFYCEPTFGFEGTLGLMMNHRISSRRRKPVENFDISSHQNTEYIPDKSIEPLIQEIFKKLDDEELLSDTLTNQNKQNSPEYPPVIPQIPSTTTTPVTTFKSVPENMPLEITSTYSSSTKKLQSISVEETATYSTPPGTVMTTTEIQKIFTKNLIADAGNDVHVYYPSTIVILNGTKTQFFTNNLNKHFITKMQWSKTESSPAFGQFSSTSQGPIVLYENLVEGVYTFVLEVWTNDNQFSQDSVNVYVHSFINANESNTKKLSDINGNTFEYQLENDLNRNIIQIELALEPSELTEAKKLEFLNEFQNFLKTDQDFKLGMPKVVLVNTKPLVSYNKRSVVMEILIVDQASDLLTSTGQGSNEESPRFVKFDKNLVNSDEVIKALRRKRKPLSAFELISLLVVSDNSKLLKTQYSNLKFTNLDIISIVQSTCNLASNDTQPCKHGKCDLYLHRCICDKYWMPNLYKYYFEHTDLTNGNNCEWNIPFVLVVAIIGITLIITIAYKLLKTFFFYLFCCCCCKNTSKDDKNSKVKRKLLNRSGNKKYLANLHNMEPYYDEEDDEDDSFYVNDEESLRNSRESLRNKFLKSPLKKLQKSLRKVPMSKSTPHKYTMLEDEDDLQLDENATLKSKGANGKTKYNDDEDVIYDHNMSISEKNKGDGISFTKKYTPI